MAKSVVSPNSIYGSMAVNGAAFLTLLAPRFRSEGTMITEAHPNVCFFDTLCILGRVKFAFNERKAAQAAAYLLRKRGGSWTYGQIIKLLYLADRKKLLDRGSPITGDRFVSMEHGTALSLIYEVVRDGPSENLGKIWSTYISLPEKLFMHPLKDDTDELSRYELRILDEIDAEFGSMTFTQLRKYTHGLREWEDPGHSSAMIPPERIFHVESRPQEEIDQANEKAKTAWSMELKSLR